MNQVKRIIPILVVIIIWIIGSNFANQLFLPSPKRVLDSFVDMAKSGLLWDSTLASFLRITFATVLTALIGIPLALLIVNYKIADNIISPVTGFMRFIPATVFTPLLLLWVGFDEKAKVIFLFIATFFAFLPSVVLIIRQTESELIDTALTMGMSKIRMIFSVQLPYALPSICQSFLMIYSVGWTYVVIAEVTNATKGLGHIMSIASARGRTDMVFVGILTLVIISYFFDAVCNFIIRKTFSWKFAKEISD
jgi:ABC-type nitrate/sulfonate/bicarbonate transport system permease component